MAQCCVSRGAAVICPDLPTHSQASRPPDTTVPSIRVSGFTVTSMSCRIVTLPSVWHRHSILTSTSVWCLCGWHVGVGTDVAPTTASAPGARNLPTSPPGCFAPIACEAPTPCVSLMCGPMLRVSVPRMRTSVRGRWVEGGGVVAKGRAPANDRQWRVGGWFALRPPPRVPRNVGHPATHVRQRPATPPILANCMHRCHLIAAGECCRSGVPRLRRAAILLAAPCFPSPCPSPLVRLRDPEFSRTQQLLVHQLSQLPTMPILLRVVPPGGFNCR